MRVPTLLAAILAVAATGCLPPAVWISLEGDGAGTVTSSSGGIACGTADEAGTCAAVIDGGSTILTAVAAPGSVFGGWTAGCAGIDPTCTLTLDTDVDVRARFERVKWELSVTRSGSGHGRVYTMIDGIDCGADCSALYPDGTTVQLFAEPDDASQLAAWVGGDCANTGSCETTLHAPTLIDAVFEAAPPYTLTVERVGLGVVTATTGSISCGTSCSDTYKAGTVVTLTATSTNGEPRYPHWSIPGCASSSTCTVTMTGDLTVTARFPANFSTCRTQFISMTAPAVAAGADSVAAGDLDSDGDADLVVGNHGAASISVLRATGPFAFASRVDYAVAGGYPYDVAIADLDRDGALDVVSANVTYLGIHLGNGDGTLQPVITTYTTGGSPYRVDIADLDGDGAPDLVVSNANNGPVGVLYNQGDGTFTAPVTYAVGPFPNGAAIGDYNGDGRPDLAVAISNGQNVSTLFGTAPRSFTIGDAFMVAPSGGPYGIATADIERDGDRDVMTVGINGAWLLRNNGPSSSSVFASPQHFVYGNGFAVVLEDMNNDGYPDLVMSTGYASIGAWPSTENGGFIPGASLATGNAPESITIADFDRDGRRDIVTANRESSSLSLFRNVGACLP